MKMEHKYILTDAQLKEAISDYIMKSTKDQFKLDKKKRLVFKNGCVEETVLFTDVEVLCKLSSEPDGGH